MTQQRIEEITTEAQRVAKEMATKSPEERADFVEYACNSISHLSAQATTEENRENLLFIETAYKTYLAIIGKN